MRHSTITDEERERIAAVLGCTHLPEGIGDGVMNASELIDTYNGAISDGYSVKVTDILNFPDEAKMELRIDACSIAAINLALYGLEQSDDTPVCMSKVIAGWIIDFQDHCPEQVRNSRAWKDLLPWAAGTGRRTETERRELLREIGWDLAARSLPKQPRACAEAFVPVLFERTLSSVEPWIAKCMDAGMDYTRWGGLENLVTALTSTTRIGAAMGQVLRNGLFSVEEMDPFHILERLIDVPQPPLAHYFVRKPHPYIPGAESYDVVGIHDGEAVMRGTNESLDWLRSNYGDCEIREAV